MTVNTGGGGVAMHGPTGPGSKRPSRRRGGLYELTAGTSQLEQYVLAGRGRPLSSDKVSWPTPFPGEGGPQGL